MNEYCCPLCSGMNNIEFYQLQFRKKDFLPDKISFMYCDSCNFVFTVPRDEKLYMQYYANCKNDQLSKELNAEHYRIQKKIIASHTDLTRGISILDFGCGCGGLLSSLRTDYTANTYIGFDPNPEQLPGITCYQDMAQITGKKFDLIICSHILEHAVNPYFLDFSLLLNENGSVYVEVPDPFLYQHRQRREYLYYLDRVHINHFSKKSLCKLFSRYGLSCLHHGDASFPYKDGKPYPATYMIFTKNSAENPTSLHENHLYKSINTYIDNDKKRKKFVSDILVYGFGDNFFRSRQPGGPLEKANIIAVIDKNAASLIKKYGEKFVFTDIASAARDYKNIPVVVCVSFESEKNVETLHNAGFTTVDSI